MVISPSEYIKKCLKIDFDNSVENIIDTGASIIIFEKGTMPIEMGEMINCFYFIIYGLVRGYYIDDDGNEVTNVLFMKMVFLVRNVIVPKTLRLFLWIVWKNVNVLNFPIF